jgi:hypothetical protein
MTERWQLPYWWPGDPYNAQLPDVQVILLQVHDCLKRPLVSSSIFCTISFFLELCNVLWIRIGWLSCSCLLVLLSSCNLCFWGPGLLKQAWMGRASIELGGLKLEESISNSPTSKRYLIAPTDLENVLMPMVLFSHSCLCWKLVWAFINYRIVVGCRFSLLIIGWCEYISWRNRRTECVERSNAKPRV